MWNLCLPPLITPCAWAVSVPQRETSGTSVAVAEASTASAQTAKRRKKKRKARQGAETRRENEKDSMEEKELDAQVEVKASVAEGLRHAWEVGDEVRLIYPGLQWRSSRFSGEGGLTRTAS